MGTETSVSQIGLDSHRKFSKVTARNSDGKAAWRKARGLAKSNRTDADLLGELPSERERWWEVRLAPRANDSGDADDEPPLGRHVGHVGRHVGHVGRRTLKWAFIEAAHGAVRKGGRFRQMFDRRTNGGRRDKNRGYIAVAHELCRLSY